MDNNADEQSLVEKTIETVKGIAMSVTDAAKSAIEPKPDPQQGAGTTNEQMLLGDAAIAPEAAPALIAPKKRRAAPKKSARQVAQPIAKTPKKTAKKAVKKSAKKSSTKSAKKTKSSAGRKAVGKNKTAKKVAKKKKAKKSKR